MINTRPILFFLLIITVSCNKTQVQLPEVAGIGKKEIVDFSPAYLFYAPGSTDSVTLNRKNLISTTNWVVHVDKRLKLKHALPKIKALQQKREKATMHKNAAARNYFSATDTLTKQLVFLDFTTTEFITNNQYSKFYIKQHPEAHMNVFTLTVNFDENNLIMINGVDVERDEFADYFKDFVPFAAQSKPALIYANFNQELSFNQYIANLNLIKSVLSDSVKLSSKQFIYDLKLLPECDCGL